MNATEVIDRCVAEAKKFGDVHETRAITLLLRGAQIAVEMERDEMRREAARILQPQSEKQAA